jgi:hypothetical protein
MTIDPWRRCSKLLRFLFFSPPRFWLGPPVVVGGGQRKLNEKGCCLAHSDRCCSYYLARLALSYSFVLSLTCLFDASSSERIR